MASTLISSGCLELRWWRNPPPAAQRQDVLRATQRVQSCRISSMKPAAFFFAATLVIVVAFFFGRWSVNAPGVPSDSIPEENGRESGSSECEACLREVAEARESESVATWLLDSYVRQDSWAPLPFPEFIGTQYQAEGFEDAVRTAVRSCPETELALAHVDCSEFPCMAFFSQPVNSFCNGVDRLENCESWRSRFYRFSREPSFLMSEDGRLEYCVVVPWPTGVAEREYAESRLTDRYRRGRSALMELWNAREPNPVDRIDEEIDFWLSIDDGSPEMLPIHEEIVVDLEAERERARKRMLDGAR